MSKEVEISAPKRFSEIIHSQIAGDAGEAGARVRKNAQRNSQAGPQVRSTRREPGDLEELSPVKRKRFRKGGKEVEV